MDNNNLRHVSLWGFVLNGLKDVLPDHAVSAWFDPVVPVEIKDGKTLVLEVPSKFFLEWIDSHYKKELSSTILQHGNGVKSYQFKIVEKKLPTHVERASIKHKEPQKHIASNLNKQYVFNNFIEGSNNEFAKNAALTIALDAKGNNYNPLIIYGGVGLGKTHLMHAIGNEVLNKNPNYMVTVVTSEKFTLDFVNSLRKNRTIEFAQQYRSSDVLLIDDIQFFRGKEQTQEQFFHTFNVLHQSGKQIVMTADKYPGEMKGLQSRLLSRFQSGLSVDIQPPNFELRVAILLDKAEQNGISLDYNIIEFIARHIKDNIRDLEGTIIRLLAKSSLLNIEIDHNLVRDVIKERTGGRLKTSVTIEDVVKKVAEVSQIPESDIVGKSRKMKIAEARQLSMFLCRDLIRTSLSNIGVYFGGRDHTTVMHAVKTISNKCENDTNLKNSVWSIKQKLGQDLQ